MKNQCSFIPARYERPDEYSLMFCNWAAVFNIKEKEYYVEIESNLWNRGEAKTVSILIQRDTHRQRMVDNIPSIKQAMVRLEKITGQSLMSVRQPVEAGGALDA